MNSNQVIYICPTCYRVCENPEDCHQHQMLSCCPGPTGGLRRKPVVDSDGVIHSRAPRWFLEAAGWIQAESRYTPLQR